MEYEFIFMYGPLGSTREFKSLTICICFKWLKKILVALFDEKAPKLEFYAKTMIQVSDTSVFISIYLKDSFPNMCDTKLNFSQFFYVCLSNLSRIGNGKLVVVTWPVGFSS